MLNNVRRKLAKAIDPDKGNEYKFVELKWTTVQNENKRMLEEAHKRFYEAHEVKGTNDEVWKWDRERINSELRKAGIEPSNTNTDFIPEHFFIGEELERYYKEKSRL